MWVAPSSSNPDKKSMAEGRLFLPIASWPPFLSLLAELVYTVVFAVDDDADDGDDSYTEVKFSICEISS